VLPLVLPLLALRLLVLLSLWPLVLTRSLPTYIQATAHPHQRRRGRLHRAHRGLHVSGALLRFLPGACVRHYRRPVQHERPHAYIYMYLALHSVQSAVANTVRTAGYTFQHFFADLHECFAQLKVRVLS